MTTLFEHRSKTSEWDLIDFNLEGSPEAEIVAEWKNANKVENIDSSPRASGHARSKTYSPPGWAA